MLKRALSVAIDSALRGAHNNPLTPLLQLVTAASSTLFLGTQHTSSSSSNYFRDCFQQVTWNLEDVSERSAQPFTLHLLLLLEECAQMCRCTCGWREQVCKVRDAPS